MFLGGEGEQRRRERETDWWAAGQTQFNHLVSIFDRRRRHDGADSCRQWERCNFFFFPTLSSWSDVWPAPTLMYPQDKSSSTSSLRCGPVALHWCATLAHGFRWTWIQTYKICRATRPAVTLPQASLWSWNQLYQGPPQTTSRLSALSIVNIEANRNSIYGQELCSHIRSTTTSWAPWIAGAPQRCLSFRSNNCSVWYYKDDNLKMPLRR